ncbi:MAG: hypothetical protein AMJ79_16070 [Phycisphaerae bacterium SM23_30]|nr:MAG: hypothetical protein AMJ79_16070 [Phycisphaerae bacterium SM23_30]
MQKEEGLTPAQQELENALQSLQPAPVGIERDRLMYRAGQVSGRRRNLVWPTVAAVLAALLTVSLAYRPAAPPTETIERIVYVPVEKPAPMRQPVVTAGRGSVNQRYRPAGNLPSPILSGSTGPQNIL